MLVGINDVNLLSVKLRECKLFKFPMQSGIDDEKWLLLNHKWLSITNLHILVGINDEKMLYCKSMYCRLVKLQKLSGIDDDK